jgi:(4S)-4-hydroxy-5-phosphonooxypentane-2,3-dione isomerase
MYSLIMRVEVSAADREAVLRAAQELGRSTLESEAGARRFDVIQDEGDPNRFFVFEGYADRAAADAHRRGPSMGQFIQAIQGLQFTLTPIGQGTALA